MHVKINRVMKIFWLLHRKWCKTILVIV
jgi:hypothetical protein